MRYLHIPGIIGAAKSATGGTASAKVLAVIIAVLAFSFGVFTDVMPASGTTELVTNGSFEDGDFSPLAGWLDEWLVAPNTDITGWSVGSGDIDWIENLWNASDLDRSIDLNGFGRGEISQSLATNPGATYLVTFDMSGNYSCNPTSPYPANLRTIYASAGNASTTFTVDVTAWGAGANVFPAMPWEQKSFIFGADSTSETLSFAGRNNSACGGVIDNVSVVEVESGSGNGNPPVDVLFIVDESVSMGPEISAVRSNINFIAEELGDTLDPQFAVLGFANGTIGRNGSSARNAPAVVRTDFTDSTATLGQAVDALRPDWGAVEAGAHATDFAMTGLDGYRADAGVCVVLITDEDSDAYPGDMNSDPVKILNREAAIAAMALRDGVFFGIVRPNAGTTNRDYGPNTGSMAQVTGGGTFNTASFTSDAQPVLDALLNQCRIAVTQGITLSPFSDTGEVGTDHTVTARIQDSLGNDVEDATVAFEVIAGPNVGTDGSADTDANGEVEFEYNGAGGLGPDTIEACFDDGDGINCAQATMTWEAPANTAPEIHVPIAQLIEATGPDGATYIADVTAEDAESPPGDLVISCDPDQTLYELGLTTVECIVTDPLGLTDEASFTVTVIDTTPPDLTVEDMTVEATGETTPVDYFPVPSATDLVDDDVDVTCTPASGSDFDLGPTPVSCTATDDEGNSTTETFVVTVYDNIAPLATCDETVNPSGKNVPKAGKNTGKSGQNPDGYYELGGSDGQSGVASYILVDTVSGFEFIFVPGTSIKLTQANGGTPSVKPGAGDTDFKVKFNGDAEVWIVDYAANTTVASCLVPQPPK